MASRSFHAVLVLAALGLSTARGDDVLATPSLDRDVLPLLKARCVKCHGPAKHEGKLNLATPRGLARGGKQGPVVVGGQLEASLLWERVEFEEMPPDEPLEPDEANILRRWIEQGAPGLPQLTDADSAKSDHWAFAPLASPEVPALRDPEPARTPIDRFLLARLEADGLGLAPEADRATLIRRVSFDLTGLPPTPEEIRRFRDDADPDAYERMVDRYLASPHYGERWGKFWLDAAGYADSNGYFNADTDRPWAYRYRDFIVRAFNEDRPFDQLLREQLAGDELAAFQPGASATPATIDRLIATHYLRNAPDGTGESDGNPDELRADRYAVLEGATQILGSSVFGLTFQCARCHDHKFEPISQKDYYALYAILQPAFDLDHWVKPQQRIIEAALPEERAAWEAESQRLDAEIAMRKAELSDWIKQNRPRGTVLFQDDFDEPLATRWSATAPGDDVPAGMPPVALDSTNTPGAVVVEGALRILESGDAGDRGLSTVRAFDWTPDEPGDWIQVTFDLIDVRIPPDGPSAERVAYFLALHDFQDKGPVPGGNVLIDGNPAGGAAVIADYPGNDSRPLGPLGQAGYRAGGNFGVRITNAGDGTFRLEHLVDGAPEERTIRLDAADLPDGGFGFEYCCGRSFLVDHVVIETGHGDDDAAKAFGKALAARREPLAAAEQARAANRERRPGRIAWISDVTPNVSAHLLTRGLYNEPAEVVEPAPPAILCDPDNPFEVRPPVEGGPFSGRRLAFARWLTRPGSRPSALLARVTVNRLWQDHFGQGLTPTSENLGYSGISPTHPELLEFLASELIAGGWHLKPIHRRILTSAAYRQSSTPRPETTGSDHDFSRFPLRRLDAEAIRDAMLAASGELDRTVGGPYVPSRHDDSGEVVVKEPTAGAHRRSLYLQQRRSQVVSLLDVFDAPSIVTSCTRRMPTTVPTQALSLLNSGFVATRSRVLADRIRREAGDDPTARIEWAFLLTLGRLPGAAERETVSAFLETQPARYAGQPDAEAHVWADLSQMLLSSNAFLYVE